MTNTPDRLDRIEGILAIVAQAQQTNTEAIAALTTDIDAMRDFLMMNIQTATENRELIVQMQSQVTGLQTENRRILDYLTNRNGGSSPPS